MARVAIGGYAHIVPMIADACIEELYRTGKCSMLAERLVSHICTLVSRRLQTESLPSSSKSRATVTACRPV